MVELIKPNEVEDNFNTLIPLCGTQEGSGKGCIRLGCVCEDGQNTSLTENDDIIF